MSNRRESILITIDDLVGDFLYYDRKEDPDLPRGAIEEAIALGEVTIGEIVSRFAAVLDERTDARGGGLRVDV